MYTYRHTSHGRSPRTCRKRWTIERGWERARDIHADGTTKWWHDDIYIYIYIYMNKLKVIKILLFFHCLISISFMHIIFRSQNYYRISTEKWITARRITYIHTYIQWQLDPPASSWWIPSTENTIFWVISADDDGRNTWTAWDTVLKNKPYSITFCQHSYTHTHTHTHTHTYIYIYIYI